MPPRILLLDNDDSFTCLFADRLRQAGSCSITIVPETQAPMHRLSDYDALIISPGPGLPSEHPASWEYLQTAIQLRKPCLGICLGFQIIALHFGSRLIQLPSPRHGECRTVHLQAFQLTNQQPLELQAGLYHSWAIARESISGELRLTGTDDTGLPMALEHKQLPLWGLQFHPESILTPQGDLLLQAFLRQAAPAQQPAPTPTIAPFPTQ